MAVGEGSSMMSFNHYAYGAVAAWLYRSLAGIAPVADQPGFERIAFAPRPGGGIRFARASLDTPFGPAAIDWRLGEGERLDVELVVPSGSSATFDPPPGWHGVATGTFRSGTHRLSLDRAPA
jgi:alpha-L-rhamnosidase